MTKIICDKCGKEITNEEKRYIFATAKAKPSEDGALPPSDWKMVKEICLNCCFELEKMFKEV